MYKRQAIDYVLTFEELACMMAGAEIDPATLAPERYINEASGFGISFPLLKGGLLRLKILELLKGLIFTMKV